MLLSKEGLAAKEKQLAKLRDELKQLGVFKGQTAIHSGDEWHDNNDFEQTEIEERRLQYLISQLEEEIAHATIIEGVESSQNAVAFNSMVKLKLIFDGDDDVEEMECKFSDVSSVGESVVTLHSPLGQAIFGKQVGDTGFYHSPAGKIFFEILSIQ